MDSNSECETEGLDIAIDHRIRALFKPVPSSSSSANGNHIAILRDGGRLLRRLDDEIQVTGTFAGPESTGGIVVALQQPREDHPFAAGTEDVIEDCDTFRALRELFQIVSCNTLDIIRDVSIIDLLPYITDRELPAYITDTEMGFASEKDLQTAFDTSLRAFCAKKPDVVLCMGKVRLPMELSYCKGKICPLENCGVGGVFDNPRVELTGSDNQRVQVKRVNCFHPSHAIHYNTEYSCFRQLLFLEVAQACGFYRGDWTEENWMRNLRRYCKELTIKLISK